MSDEKEEVETHDPYYEPIVNLPPVELQTLEEDEEELTKLRGKLFRYDTESEPPEWKERGTGDVKILKHRSNGTCRVLMRRDKTHKICANHYVLPHMELKPNCGSEKAWVWSTFADFADEEAKQELLALRFGSAENAQKFKAKFDEAKELMEAKMKEDLDQMVKDPESKSSSKAESATGGDDSKQDSSSNPASKPDTSKPDASGSDGGAADAPDKVADKLGELSVTETAPSGDVSKTYADDGKVNGDS